MTDVDDIGEEPPKLAARLSDIENEGLREILFELERRLSTIENDIRAPGNAPQPNTPAERLSAVEEELREFDIESVTDGASPLLQPNNGNVSQPNSSDGGLSTNEAELPEPEASSNTVSVTNGALLPPEPNNGNVPPPDNSDGGLSVNEAELPEPEASSDTVSVTDEALLPLEPNNGNVPPPDNSDGGQSANGDGLGEPEPELNIEGRLSKVEKEFIPPKQPLDVFAFIGEGPDKRWPFVFGILLFLFQYFLLMLLHAEIMREAAADNGDNPDKFRSTFDGSKFYPFPMKFFRIGSEGHRDYLAAFYPSYESRYTLTLRVFAALAFIALTSGATLDVFNTIAGAKNDLTIWLRLSNVCRGLFGAIACLLTFDLINTSSGSQIILSIATVDYISSLDEKVFDMAAGGWLGSSMWEAANRLKYNGEYMEDEEAKKEKEKTNKWKSTSWIIGVSTLLFFFFYQYFGPVAVFQGSSEFWSTKLLRLQLNDPDLQLYSGCYQSNTKREKSTKRFIYTAVNSSHNATFRYCNVTQQWSLLERDVDDPCNITVEGGGIQLMRSPPTTKYDISTLFFGSTWRDSDDLPLDMFFFENTNNSDNPEYLNCDALPGDGDCDGSLNVVEYSFDGGDCCASTCNGDTCGDSEARIFGEVGYGFPNCRNDSMTDIGITLVSFEMGDSKYNGIGWDQFQQSSGSTLQLECNGKSVFSVGIIPSMARSSYTAKVEPAANCSLILTTIEPIFNASATSSIPDDSEITVESVFRNTIPTEIGLLANSTVKRLDLSGHSLIGTIPTELALVKSLKSLQLANNTFSGSIPSNLGELTNLEHLDLTNNTFSGSIPSNLGELTNLEHLDLTNNTFSGSIPSNLGELTNLEHLDLSYNDFGGAIPSSIGGLTDLEYLNLRDNMLNEEIPTEIGLLKKLNHIDLRNNNLTGNIPKAFLRNWTEEDLYYLLDGNNLNRAFGRDG